MSLGEISNSLPLWCYGQSSRASR